MHVTKDRVLINISLRALHTDQLVEDFISKP